MSDGVKRLTKELWDLMVSDDGKKVGECRALKKREDRRGRVKRLLCKAIDESSLGCFNGLIYYFGGKVYLPCSIRSLKKVLYDILAARIELPDADLSKLNDIYEDCLNAVFSKSLSVDNSIMVFRNGVLDVEHGKFWKVFNKRFVQMWAVDYDYNPDARTFKWYQFLNQVLPQQYLQEVLQMFLGATFIDRQKVKIEHILILLGKGANGKSVIQRAICGVLGEQYVATQEIGRLCARGIDGDEAVALVNGKRLNYCTEMEATDFYKKSARLKAIVSGEKVPARFRYGIGFEAMNIPLLMANANQLPIFNKKDDAMVRRIYVVPFEVSIPPERQNKTLNDELVEEYPAILNWILEGRDKFIANGYRLPTDKNLHKFILDEEAEYSPVLKFMKVHGWLPRMEGVELEPMNWMKLSDLYNSFDRWCTLNNLPVIGKSSFCYTLENQGGFKKKRFSNGIRFAVFGDVTMKALVREQEKLKKLKKDRPGVSIMWVDGVAWVTSRKALASYAGVGIGVVTRLANEGKFDDYTKSYREKLIFDVKACCAIMKEMHVIATDAEKDIISRLNKELKYMRWTYNQWATDNGFPYRKYEREDQIEPGITVVTDETTYEQTIVMARKSGYDVSRALRYKTPRGAFSQGGKGYFKSADERPSLEERQTVGVVTQ